MIRNYQERERIKEPIILPKTMATIQEIIGNTARLNFGDGISQKYYKLIGSGYNVGDTVSIDKRNGTYIITGIL